MGKNGDFHQLGMENPIKMDDLGRLGSPIDGWFLRENPSING
jgi:hypothetical protein